MRTLFNGWFIAGCLTWVIVSGLRKIGHPLPPFINGYINDAAAIPVIANISLWFQRVFIIKNNYYVLALWHVVFIVVYLSLIFEVLLPLLSKTYTGDWIDALLYAAGGVFFYKVMNKPLVIRRGNN
ncbi:MAG: hypothetical protein ACXVB0_12540 [Mucilaginibacter sp.]